MQFISRNWGYFFWACLGVLYFQIVVSGYGLGLTVDSVNYLSVAQNLSVAQEYQNYAGESATVIPPLYPLILSLGSRLFEIEFFAILLHSLLFFCLLVMSWYILCELGNVYFASASMILLILSPVTYIVFSFVFTELLYITITMANLIMLHKYLQKKTPFYLLILVIFTTLAPLTRYIGTVNIGTTFLVLAIYLKTTNVRQKIFVLGLISLVSCFPLFVWMLRNYSADGTYLGPRYPTDLSFFSNFETMGSVILQWFLPIRITEKLISLEVLILSVIICILMFVFWLVRRWLNIRTILIFVIFASFYILWLLFSTTSVAIDPIDDRLLAPLYLPLIVIIHHAASSILKLELSVSRQRFVRTLVPLMFILLSAFFIWRATSILPDQINDGVGGYSGRVWTATGNSLPPEIFSDTLVYSTHPDAIWYLTDGELLVEWIPSKHAYRSYDSVINDVESLKTWWPEENPAYVLAFRSFRDTLFHIEELENVVPITLLESSDYMTLYITSN